MTIRRDYTNGSGYICPAENEAIYKDTKTQTMKKRC